MKVSQMEVLYNGKQKFQALNVGDLEMHELLPEHIGHKTRNYSHIVGIFLQVGFPQFRPLLKRQKSVKLPF